MIELFLWRYGLYILIIWSFIANACASPSKIGYWQDDKPWRGSIQANRENVHPYRQCVDEETFKNIKCK